MLPLMDWGLLWILLPLGRRSDLSLGSEDIQHTASVSVDDNVTINALDCHDVILFNI